jgi:hypothetical protein
MLKERDVGAGSSAPPFPASRQRCSCQVTAFDLADHDRRRDFPPSSSLSGKRPSKRYFLDTSSPTQLPTYSSNKRCSVRRLRVDMPFGQNLQPQHFRPAARIRFIVRMLQSCVVNDRRRIGRVNSVTQIQETIPQRQNRVV